MESVITKKIQPKDTTAASSRKEEYASTLSELERYKLLVENVQDYAIFFMDPNGYIQTWNKGAEKNKGYTHDEIIGKHFSIFYSAEDKADKKPERELAIAIKMGRVEDEDWRVRKDGSKFWANVVITALYSDDGKLQGFAKVTRNLTERKDHEDSLRSANSILQEQQRELQRLNESKDDFIALASHQLRTPATAIKQLLGLLLEGFEGPLPDNIQNLIQRTYDSNERQIMIINSLLRVAQIDAGKVVLRKKVKDINEVTSSLIQQYENIIKEKDQQIVRLLHQEPVVGYIDEDYYRMAIENVLDNASKYTAPGGEIKIETGLRNNYAYVAISDTGVGMTSEGISSLFEKFRRIPNSLSHEVAGSGLGLYWVDKVIDLHQGNIEVESQQDKGTTFAIYVPAGVTDV